MNGDDERRETNRIEEALYGAIGTSDCHKVGIWGGCGLECWVYIEGRCPEPDEMLPRIEDESDLDFHHSLYLNSTKDHRKGQRMPNEHGWMTREEAEATGLPLWIQQSHSAPGRWTKEPYDHAVLLTKTRCKELKMPIMLHNAEPPSGYRYNNRADSSYRYVPIYDRTSVFEKGELPYSILKDGEQMGKPKEERES